MLRPLPLVCAALLALPAFAAAAGRAPNVVLISLNALRADHLKAYGYAKETAPNITRFAGESAVFEQAAAQSHWTLSSLASLFTSRYVHNHGLYERGQKLPAGVFKPHLATTKRSKKDISVSLNMTFTIEEARGLAALFQISGSLDAAATKRALTEKAKEYLLSLLNVKRAKRA